MTQNPKYQHFVPDTYLDGWIMNDTPAYYFKDKKIDMGKDRNPNSILKQSHTYTVGYIESIIMSHCPLVRDDFICMIQEIVNRRNIYVKNNGKKIDFNVSLDIFPELFRHLDSWEFYYKNSDNIASKCKIINEIKGLRSYVIENAFSKLLENNWKQDYNNFLIDIKKKRELNVEKIHVEYNYLDKIIKFAILSMQRNPEFDFFGFYNNSDFDYNFIAKEIFKLPEDSINDAKPFWDNIKRCVQLHQLYESLYGVDIKLHKHKSIYEMIDGILKTGRFRIIIYSANGSSFITSDNCSFFNKNNVYSKNLNMMIFPLSAYFLLTIGTTTVRSDISKIDCKGLTNKEVKIFNRLIYNNARSAIVSKEKFLATNVW